MTFAQPFTDYEILDRVGAGAMGTVFKARHKKLNRIVALKVLKPSLARDSRYVDRLRREARIVASLNDPHIVTGYDLGEEGGYHFFVMEFIEGKSLRALLVEWGVFAEEYVLKVGQQVAQALDHAYQRGVIHRDIKPGNILIDEHGSVKLTDMGLAKGPADMTLTRDGATVGTPQYISPEQARNPQDVDVRTDLYSLGATLYHMATGVPPFRGDTMADLILKVLNATPTPPNEVNPALSEGLSLVLRKLLAKDLRVRYQTPRELLADLDRVQRSMPPEVDPARLSALEAERRPNLLLRAAGALVVAGLLGGAVWVGMQLRGEPVASSTADHFLAELDDALRSKTTAGDRLLHLRMVKVAAPAGTEGELHLRERQVAADLQAAVDDAAASFLDQGWHGLVSWLHDPAVWPDRSRTEQERVLPRLRERTGLLQSQLQESVRMERVEALLAAVDREVKERDAELLRRFDGFLGITLQVQVDELLRSGNYAGAERLWANALQWFDGVRVPTHERLAEPVAQKARERRDFELQRLRPTIDAAEATVAAALAEQAAAVVHHLRERLAAGALPEFIAAELARLRPQLLEVWPSSSKFRPARNPWPQIEQLCGQLQVAVDLAIAEAAARRFEARCDLAVRALCQGSPADGLALLEGVAAPSERHAARLQLHRRALAAAGLVEAALIQGIARANGAVPAFPRHGSGFAVELRVESESGRSALWCQRPGEVARLAAVTEFRFLDLLGRVRQLVGDPLAALPREEAALGVAVLTLVGEELAGMGARLAALGQPEVVEDLWPRIARVREQRRENSLDRGDQFAQLRTLYDAARRGGERRELEAMVQLCTLRFPPDLQSEAERQLIRAANSWLALAGRRTELLAEIAKAAPAGAVVEADIEQQELRAVVQVQAPLLLGGAKDNWHVRDQRIEFVGATGPWSELPLQQLQCISGIEAAASRVRLEVDLVIPPSTVGSRYYVFEFRGIAVMLAFGGGDTVHAALVEGDPRREEPAQRAFQRAMATGFAVPRVQAIPGAVHRLVIDVHTPLRGARAMVKVEFDQQELLGRQVFLDTQRAATMVLWPRQEIALQQVVVRGFGL